MGEQGASVEGREFSSNSRARLDGQSNSIARNTQQQRRKKNKSANKQLAAPAATQEASLNGSASLQAVHMFANQRAATYQEQERRVQASSHNQPEYTSESRHQLGKFILPAVRLALDHINNNQTILGAYKLEVVPRDTEVSGRKFLGRPINLF